MREEMRLKEQNFGKYEGTPRNGEEFQRAKANFINSYEGGESMLKLCHRIYDLLDDIKKNQIRRRIFWLHITGSQERYSLILVI